MLTRCPACDTRFRVTAEQIKARVGRVRCGACQHAFNALDSLIEEPVVMVAATPAKSGAAVDTGPELAVSPTPTLAHDSMPTHDLSPMPGTAQGHSGFEPPGDDHASADADAPVDAATVADNPSEQVEAVPGEADAATAETEATASPDADIEAAVEDGDEAAAEAQPRHWPWITGSLIALLLLGLQAVLAFRVEMAVLWPETKPLLVSLCDLADCEVGLPAKVGLVGIEASDLHPDTETRGRLTLTATLKNRAPFAQQFPHLELTLTDTADKPVARKVLAPTDYLPPPTAFADGMPPNADITVTLGVDSGEMAASGYRLYLFYP